MEDTPVGLGKRPAPTFDEAALAASPELASGLQLAAAGPHVPRRRIAKHELLVVRNFAPGQEEQIAALEGLRARIAEILQEYGGEPNPVPAELAMGAVLLPRIVFSAARRSPHVQALAPHQIVTRICAEQPPSYMETVSGTTQNVSFFSPAEEGKKNVGLRLGGTDLWKEAAAAAGTLQALVGEDSGITISYDKSMLQLGSCFPHVPHEAYDPIRGETAAAFPRGTEFALLPSTLLVPPGVVPQPTNSSYAARASNIN